MVTKAIFPYSLFSFEILWVIHSRCANVPGREGHMKALMIGARLWGQPRNRAYTHMRTHTHSLFLSWQANATLIKVTSGNKISVLWDSVLFIPFCCFSSLLTSALWVFWKHQRRERVTDALTVQRLGLVQLNSANSKNTEKARTVHVWHTIKAH